jgi:hypothetical protein
MSFLDEEPFEPSAVEYKRSKAPREMQITPGEMFVCVHESRKKRARQLRYLECGYVRILNMLILQLLYALFGIFIGKVHSSFEMCRNKVY